ncbi:MarR family winged helix-turn-helix transcriptional regulator [Aureimonas sp. N4]|uniref:MarR family winged helix-turn-helix transcriptional regulator n=1 Tax=Aureimonas sp. N4 TaxID=1638165 RepID=UPI000B205527|nr:helix-turn-helix domain-containing protein [Aureimonas sp. N4]
MSDPIDDEDYCALALFRRQLRSFLSFSEGAAAEAGLTAQQHQALLAIRAAAERSLPVGELADQLHLRPHSATGLVDRLARLGLVER